MTNQGLKAFALAGIILVGVTECAMINAALPAKAEPQTQSLSIPKVMDIIEISKMHKTFQRADVEIVEVAPWLKPENQELTLSNSELISVLKNAGFSGYGLKMAWAIVKAESTMRPYAHNDNPRTGDNSYGLFQINMYRGLEAARQEAYGLQNNEELFDVNVNAAIAYKISKGGTSWSAWTTKSKAEALVSQFPG